MCLDPICNDYIAAIIEQQHLLARLLTKAQHTVAQQAARLERVEEDLRITKQRLLAKI